MIDSLAISIDQRPAMQPDDDGSGDSIVVMKDVRLDLQSSHCLVSEGLLANLGSTVPPV
jgi:hypothetical protein